VRCFIKNRCSCSQMGILLAKLSPVFIKIILVPIKHGHQDSSIFHASNVQFVKGRFIRNWGTAAPTEFSGAVTFTPRHWRLNNTCLLKPTFMHYIVYIKSHTNFHSKAFWHPVIPFSGSSVLLYFLLIASVWWSKRLRNDCKNLISASYMNVI